MTCKQKRGSGVQPPEKISLPLCKSGRIAIRILNSRPKEIRSPRFYQSLLKGIYIHELLVGLSVVFLYADKTSPAGAIICFYHDMFDMMLTRRYDSYIPIKLKQSINSYKRLITRALIHSIGVENLLQY